MNRVKRNPELHDKVEFEVMFTCTYPGIAQMMTSLEHEDTYPAPFTPSELERLRYALLTLSNRLMDPKADAIDFNSRRYPRWRSDDKMS